MPELGAVVEESTSTNNVTSAANGAQGSIVSNGGKQTYEDTETG